MSGDWQKDVNEWRAQQATAARERAAEVAQARWADVVPRPRPKAAPRVAKITAREMVERWLDGARQADIAQIAGVDAVRVSNMMRRYMRDEFGYYGEFQRRHEPNIRRLIYPTFLDRLLAVVRR